jgi:hypothetical protein
MRSKIIYDKPYTFACEHCGKPKTLTAKEHGDRMRQGKSHLFCSKGCYHAWRKGRPLGATLDLGYDENEDIKYYGPTEVHYETQSMKQIQPLWMVVTSPYFQTQERIIYDNNA